MRYFAGMSREHIADALGVSIATVKRDLSIGDHTSTWIAPGLQMNPTKLLFSSADGAYRWRKFLIQLSF